ncbi:MAG: hypothetical protein R8G34_23065 [Paracoccaceae bacterium]|nr:hypothetical protein [Paracoccaceae bacterium]
MKSQFLVCSNEPPKAGVLSVFLRVAFCVGFAEKEGLEITNLPNHRRLPVFALWGGVNEHLGRRIQTVAGKNTFRAFGEPAIPFKGLIFAVEVEIRLSLPTMA